MRPVGQDGMEGLFSNRPAPGTGRLLSLQKTPSTTHLRASCIYKFIEK